MGSTTRVIRMEEVKQHNKDKDCWIVIHDNVYDVSQFLEEHPGGDFTILEHAGAFATEAFEDVGHSESARDLMKKYHVGVLAEEDKESTLKFSSNYSREKMASFTYNWINFAIPISVLLTGAYLARRFLRRR